MLTLKLFFIQAQVTMVRTYCYCYYLLLMCQMSQIKLLGDFFGLRRRSVGGESKSPTEPPDLKPVGHPKAEGTGQP